MSAATKWKCGFDEIGLTVGFINKIYLLLSEKGLDTIHTITYYN